MQVSPPPRNLWRHPRASLWCYRSLCFPCRPFPKTTVLSRSVALLNRSSLVAVVANNCFPLAVSNKQKMQVNLIWCPSNTYQTGRMCFSAPGVQPRSLAWEKILRTRLLLFSPGRNSARAENLGPVWSNRARIFSHGWIFPHAEYLSM